MTKLDKLLTTAAFAVLLAGGLAVLSQDAFAQAASSDAPKTTKAANSSEPKAANTDADKSKSKSFDYELLSPPRPGQNG